MVFRGWVWTDSQTRPFYKDSAIMEVRVCEQCNCEYTRSRHCRPGQFAKRRFCSRECSGRSTGIDFMDLVATEPNTGCELWIGGTGHLGYGIRLFRGRYTHAHRVAWIMSKGDIPAGLSVLHKCDTPACVNVDHLFLGTQSDNIQDMLKKRRGTAGGKAWNAKLTQEDVEFIRSALTSEPRFASQRKLARMFGVSQTLISGIMSGKFWKKQP